MKIAGEKDGESRMKAKGFLRENGMFFSMLMIFFVMSLVTKWWTGDWTFISAENLSNLSQQVTVTGILAIGMTMVILIGGIDLGVGSVLALSAAVLALTVDPVNVEQAVKNPGLKNALQSVANPATGILLALAAGALIGAWNGFIVSRFKLLSFVVTLATLTMARGLAYLVSGSQSLTVKADVFRTLGVYSLDKLCYEWWYKAKGLPVPAETFPGFSIAFLILVFVVWAKLHMNKRDHLMMHGHPVESSQAMTGRIALKAAGCAALGLLFASHQGIPVMVIFFAALATIAHFVLNHTVFGRHLYAIGGNKDAARLSGIQVERYTFLVFLIMGVMSALAGIVATSRAQAASPATQGVLSELEAIAAVVVGGTSLMGGIGTIGGTVIGVLIIGIVVNGMILMALPNPVQLIFKGLLIMAAVLIDMRTKARK